MIKFAVISFPGTNCEAETVRAFKRNGMDAEIVLWNDPKLSSRVHEFSGYCIAGGFSYEDRGRSGIVAAQEPIIEILQREDSEGGKIILGICNGAQILVETGLIPGFDDKSLAMSLGWNEMRQDNEIIDTGFYNTWTHLKNTAPRNRSAFNDFDELLHIPFAHGEGRFVVKEEVLNHLEENQQIIFKYTDAAGNINPDFPVNPNGSTVNIAAVCNSDGNVMAIMPHPERDPLGNGNAIFQSIKRWAEKEEKIYFKPPGDFACHDDIRPTALMSVDVEIFVSLIITDNTERTIQKTFERNGLEINLKRYLYYGITLEDGITPEEAVEKIILTGELANFNKELVYVKINNNKFIYDKDKGLEPCDIKLENYVIVSDHKDFIGKSKTDAINLHAGEIIKDICYGVVWDFADTYMDVIHEAIESKVLYNPHSMYIVLHHEGLSVSDFVLV